MRIFVAVDLPDPILDPLVRAQAQLRCGRVVEEENLHLTMAFLGDVEAEPLDELHGRLEALRPGPVSLAVTGLDLFGDMAAPRLVCALVSETPELSALHAQVVRAARTVNIALERRRFRPHITLARFGKTARADGPALRRFLDSYAGLTVSDCRAGSFGIYASTLRPEGASYDCLATYPLI